MAWFASLTRRNSPARRRRDEQGQVLMVAALMVPLILGFAGLAIDIGLAATVRTNTQSAADSAALAAAGVLADGGTTAQAKAAANSFVTKNGFAPSEATVSIPPVSGVHAGDGNYAEVVISHSQPTVFIRAVGIGSVTQSARGVAGLDSVVNKNYAMIVLNKTKCSAYSQSSGNTLTLNGGGIMVNSSCKPSANQGGSSKLNATFADYFNAGSWDSANNVTNSVTPTAVNAQLEDPLASRTRPVAGAASPDSGGTAAAPKVKGVTGTATLRPGTYYGGLKVSGSGTVTFQPGLYIFAGGGFDYSASATLKGDGVTFFNTESSKSACGSIALQGSGQLSLKAPTSGTYKDILFWADDDCTQQLKYAGSTYTTVGVIYLPNATLNVSGGGSLGALQIIVDSFSYSGSTTVTVDYAGYVTITPPDFRLVE